ncbi:hypothetical protein QCA50_017352 [Cerrena zonata]|uniref:Uncharacterized protein n=1 Tax=Cerrena zonata TaxID=2478898 RepID=A0AAW0FKV4_9APHY
MSSYADGDMGSQYTTQSDFTVQHKVFGLARDATAKGAQKTSRLFEPNGLLDSQTGDTQWVEEYTRDSYSPPARPRDQPPLFAPSESDSDAGPPMSVTVPVPSEAEAAHEFHTLLQGLLLSEIDIQISSARSIVSAQEKVTGAYKKHLNSLLLRRQEIKGVFSGNRADDEEKVEVSESKHIHKDQKGKGREAIENVASDLDEQEVDPKLDGDWMRATIGSSLSSNLAGGHLFQDMGSSLSTSKSNSSQNSALDRGNMPPLGRFASGSEMVDASRTSHSMHLTLPEAINATAHRNASIIRSHNGHKKRSARDERGHSPASGEGSSSSKAASTSKRCKSGSQL